MNFEDHFKAGDILKYTPEEPAYLTEYYICTELNMHNSNANIAVMKITRDNISTLDGNDWGMSHKCMKKIGTINNIYSVLEELTKEEDVDNPF